MVDITYGLDKENHVSELMKVCILKIYDYVSHGGLKDVTSDDVEKVVTCLFQIVLEETLTDKQKEYANDFDLEAVLKKHEFELKKFKNKSKTVKDLEELRYWRNNGWYMNLLHVMEMHIRKVVELELNIRFTLLKLTMSKITEEEYAELLQSHDLYKIGAAVDKYGAIKNEN